MHSYGIFLHVYLYVSLHFERERAVLDWYCPGHVSCEFPGLGSEVITETLA